MTKFRKNPVSAFSITTGNPQEGKSKSKENFYNYSASDFENEAVKEEDMIEKLHSEYQTIKASFHEKMRSF